MRPGWVLFVGALVVALFPVSGAAVDAPHDPSFTTMQCDDCHLAFDTTPSGMNDYSRGCVDCHRLQPPGSPRGFPWQTGDQAVIGKSGSQHNWSALAANPAAGAKLPTIVDLSKRLVDGRLQCTVCHDPHHGNEAFAPDSRHTSIPLDVARNATVGTGAGQLTLRAAGTVAKGFRVKVQTSEAGGGTIVVSHDFALAAPSWFNWDGAAWIAGTAAGPGRPFTSGAPVELDTPGVMVELSGTPAAGDYWDFYVSYPQLRMSNVDDGMCVHCHADRVMNHVRASGNDRYYAPDGVRQFSHPVGVALNANGKNYDVTPATMLDADGSTQAVGDGRRSNDLRLDADVVRCTTCHAPHNADSNSLTD